jgi:hypothetical protein
MDIKSDLIIERTAIKENNHFKHFGIHEITSDLYGYKPSEIITIKLKVSENQTKPDVNDGSMDADYWGWFDYERKDFTLIYPKMFLLNMCFPSGINAAERTNQGKAYRLEIIK